jgi:copper homeostasis protein
MYILEIACFNFESAVIAQQSGADRIEFCSEFSLGGLTPTIDGLIKVRKSIGLDIFVMIRPRGGDFVYSNDEFAMMKREIELIKKVGIQGFVFGILNSDQTVDIERNKILVELAKPYPCTFHKAFDHTKDPYLSLEQIINCGFTNVLTSRLEKDALTGSLALEKIVGQAKYRINVIVGGGVRSNNIEQIKELTKSKVYHSSAIIDDSQTADKEEIRRLKNLLK